MSGDDARLSRIETMWSVVRRAHDGSGNEVCAAQQALLDRYGGAIKRYLLAALRSEDAADDVFQEFALRFVRGDLQSADPQRGRFRSFVKTIVYRLAVDHQRRARKERDRNVMAADILGEEDEARSDAQFAQSWREDLLARTWGALEVLQQESGTPHFTLMKLRVEFPDMRSNELADELAQRTGGTYNAGAVRVALHRARELFADLMLDEVVHTLERTTPDEIEAELIDLDLMKYTRPAFDRRFGGAAGTP